MRGKITIRSVASLVAAGGKEVTLRDAVLSGFEVRARAGGAKVYATAIAPAPGARHRPSASQSASTVRPGHRTRHATKHEGC
jgi:hypothetical protein